MLHRPTHPEHVFVRGAMPHPRIPEVVIPLSSHAAAADVRTRPPLIEMPRNALIASLSPLEQELLAPHLEHTVLASGQQIARPHTAITHLYFPESAIVALQLGPAEGGRSVDVATVGSEGMVGVAHLVGGEPGPEAAVTRVAGAAVRISVVEFERVASAVPSLRARLQRYAASLLAQVAQTALCVQTHNIEQRLASLILLIADRIDGAPIVVTHEQLGLMLGIRRPGVTQVAASLRSRGLVTYRRGRVLVSDPAGLAAVACSCYPRLRDAMQHGMRTDGRSAFTAQLPVSRPVA